MSNISEIKHIGLIMDGNRRWAKAHGLLSYQGHDKGTNVFIDVCDWCLQDGIKYLTVYAFSTENWQRSQIEVKHIFKLLENFFIEYKDKCIEKGIQIRIIGENSHFDKKTIKTIDDIENQTCSCNNLHVQIALSYGGRNEIIRAAAKLANDVVIKHLSINDITEDVFSSYLDTAGIPDVDMVIRTGGQNNRRLSNFLPWQTVYSELYFSDVLWPDFSREEFQKALEYYDTITRTNGK